METSDQLQGNAISVPVSKGPLEILSEATKEAGIDVELALGSAQFEHSDSEQIEEQGEEVVLKGYELSLNEADDDEPHADSDGLTDSNSSGKMSPPHDNVMIDNNDTDELSVPMNFPIKGRILARLRLQGRGYEYFMTKPKLVIGRNSSKGAVDIDIGHSNFISRTHLTIVHEHGDFYLGCGGKNGVFVDDTFQKIGAPKMQLPKSCALRFPSTQIVIVFDAAECFIEQYSTSSSQSATSYQFASGPKALLALSVQIPENGQAGELKRPYKPFFSPCPSPTGTVSAVNSCPASPTSVLVHSRKAAGIPANSSQRTRYLTDAVMVKDSRIPLFEGDESKPPYSYAQLIVQAISSSPDKQMTLSGIYGYISRNYSYYRANEKGWQNSIRHNLSLNRYFIKVARSMDEPGKGCFWSIDALSEPKLVAQAFRRRNKRGIPYFRGTPCTMSSMSTQSCPASPINIAIYSPDLCMTTAAAPTTTPHTTVSATNNIVTVATVNSVAEAITMQSKIPQIIDMSHVRAIQSAPGSPQGYKVFSPASLISARMLPKGAASVIGSKSSGITLIQPITSLTTVPAVTGKSQGSIVTLSSHQAQLLKSGGNVLSPLASIPVTSLPVAVTAPVTSGAPTTAGVVVNSSAARPRVLVGKRPILIQYTTASKSAELTETVLGSPAKLAKTDGS